MSDYNCTGWTVWTVSENGDLTNPVRLHDARSGYARQFAKTPLFGAFDHDSRRLVVVDNQDRLELWVVPSGQNLLTLHMPTTGLRDVAFSADGEHLLLVRESESAVEIRSACSGCLLGSLLLEGDEDGELWSIPLGRYACFSPCGTYVTSSPVTVGGVKMWHTADGSLITGARNEGSSHDNTLR
ncbi:hypothetical protein BD310DRAFT_720718 [Dichomitus squalens]|uniref:Uncharacterized protein n=1 Tax=Dichomitus squalens TaxID=114155 RepID=A0A4V2K770_9APHY|nr:hypothetical protein BD310DRAFT_720718 [Dichomitus squalens]